MYPETITVPNPDHLHTFALADGGQAFVLQDHHAQSPREWDNLSRMATMSRDYVQPDGIDADTDLLSVVEVARLHGMDEAGVKRLLEADPSKYELMFERDEDDELCLEYGCNRRVLAVKEFAYGHRQEANGYAVIFEEDWLAAGMDGYDVLPEDALRAEIDTYQAYVEGRCYGVIINDAEGNEVDSCWGFQGYEYDDPKLVNDNFDAEVQS